MNRTLADLPLHLSKLTVDQDYDSYTAQDHAVWRYVMQQNVKHLKHVAHESYLTGLKKTGIRLDRIPSIDEMNDILQKIGWAAVCVDGFIPPAAFMEFQANKVLVIAADIRSINQIAYTPAPDIIHEAAGHAPIIADEKYANYLQYFGFVGSRAFSSAKDYELYEAIRHLSILKADPNTAASTIDAAMLKLSELEKDMGTPSEMALIRNLHWWTVEYGLIGTLEKPKIYGAGLLSSIGESYGAMQDAVEKIPYTVDAVDYGFDITTQQPQLFVTPDFNHLTRVLDEFTERMAIRRGGLDGIMKAIESKNMATCVYSSGLEVSGVFQEVIIEDNTYIYLKSEGPTQLSYKGKQLNKHGKDTHAHGFGSPVGRLKNQLKPLRKASEHDLKKLGLIAGKECFLEFESGIKLKGIFKSSLRMDNNLLLLSFSDCLVQYKDQVLFQPEWGIFDMAVGEEIVSAYSGLADPGSFGWSYPVPVEKTHKIQYTPSQRELHKLYQEIRDIRDGIEEASRITEIWELLKQQHPTEWLLPLEILEYLNQVNILPEARKEIFAYLRGLQSRSTETDKLIGDGLDAISGSGMSHHQA